MRFWDSSALVVLHVQQEATARIRDLYARDPSVLAWVMSGVEVRSALCRLGRDGAVTPADLQEAITRAEAFWEAVHFVTLVDAVKGRAKRLLDIHPLRAADALQLAAALTAAYDDPLGWEFVSLDERLREAAGRERFTVVP
jgi:uncharacterized protein